MLEAMMTLLDERVTVWTGTEGVPERFVWNGVRYRVSDTPTPLEEMLSGLTHIPVLPPAWRFQGTSEEGDTRVFDVLFDGVRQEWLLLHTYK
jgi:hypothetical protein